MIWFRLGAVVFICMLLTMLIIAAWPIDSCPNDWPHTPLKKWRRRFIEPWKERIKRKYEAAAGRCPAFLNPDSFLAVRSCASRVRITNEGS